MKRFVLILVIICFTIIIYFNNLANSQDIPKIGDVLDTTKYKCPRHMICKCISWSHVPEFHCTKIRIIAWKKIK